MSNKIKSYMDGTAGEIKPELDEEIRSVVRNVSRSPKGLISHRIRRNCLVMENVVRRPN